MAQNGAVEVIG